ncbi:carbohydrate-binding module family 1 protein [Periconia macrospinosa]|uniref:Carbohydrate-binding module family 1 protein n=1 Tax=Periconia macrospinosa TaxID=97972 RepID=A0A2V1E882_9PLEO|nr:carbohydrate-binding module family 1 protein [Periconia macrospinosa]
MVSSVPNHLDRRQGEGEISFTTCAGFDCGPEPTKTKTTTSKGSWCSLTTATPPKTTTKPTENPTTKPTTKPTTSKSTEKPTTKTTEKPTSTSKSSQKPTKTTTGEETGPSSTRCPVPLYYQCGGYYDGKPWNGCTKCVSGAKCIWQNDWYYQCVAEGS